MLSIVARSSRAVLSRQGFLYSALSEFMVKNASEITIYPAMYQLTRWHADSGTPTGSTAMDVARQGPGKVVDSVGAKVLREATDAQEHVTQVIYSAD
jgi:hypothetical protein